MINLRSLFVAIASLAMLPSLFGVSQIRADVADGEREFVQQLLDRAMYGLAEQFCYRQLEGPHDVNHLATWEMMLSECQQQHAWNMDADSRNGMIRESAERLTEFLRNNAPSAENDLMLRVRQIELLSAAGLMEEIIQTPISSLQLLPAATATSSENFLPRRVSPETRFATEAINQAWTLADSLLTQIEEVRREVDRDAVRAARERTRMVQTDVAFVRYRLADAKDSKKLREEAETLIEQMQKTTSDDWLRFRCRVMLAEIQLDLKDFDAFQLRYGNTQAAASNQNEKASAAALKIRSLLQQGLPSEALQEYVEASKNRLALTQELQTLRLEGLLQLLVLLYQLDESPQRTELENKTQLEFQQLRDKTLALTTGVWRQRCVRIADHFDRVLQVGPDAALELEYVSELVDDGDVVTARQRLQSLAQRLSSKSPILAARVQLQAGNLSIRLREWPIAKEELQLAKEKFQAANDLTDAAAADLLRVYVIGQQWSSGTTGEVTEADYQAAIESHLSAFPDQKTLTQARDWKARLLRANSPLKAAREFLDLAAIQEPPSTIPAAEPAQPQPMSLEQTLRLCLAGDCLIDALATPGKSLVDANSSSVTEMKTLRDEFLTRAADADLQQPESSSLYSRILKCQQSGLALVEPLPATSNWPELLLSNRKLLESLQMLERATSAQPEVAGEETPSAETSTSSQKLSTGENTDLQYLRNRAETICHTMIVLCSVRQLANAADYETSVATLKLLPRKDRLTIAQSLGRQMNPDAAAVPGDVQLALFLISLVTESSASSAPGLTVDDRLMELQLLQALGHNAKSTTAYDRCLNDLLAMTLDESQIARTADIVTQSAGTQSSTTSKQTAKRFWQSVQKRTKAGQNAWLESSLQLALIAESTGDKKEAAKILGVVDVLHPEWGTPARKARADELRSRLEAKK
ncbi:MAG: hypothetical protein U0936_06095 [Planctomycetaceae bacterium]